MSDPHILAKRFQETTERVRHVVLIVDHQNPAHDRNSGYSRSCPPAHRRGRKRQGENEFAALAQAGTTANDRATMRFNEILDQR